MVRGKRIGLTGGIGSGKSTVATLFSRHGAACIDADAVSRSVTAAGGAAIPQIQSVFGPAVIDAQGALDQLGEAMATALQSIRLYVPDDVLHVVEGGS